MSEDQPDPQPGLQAQARAEAWLRSWWLFFGGFGLLLMMLLLVTCWPANNRPAPPATDQGPVIAAPATPPVRALTAAEKRDLIARANALLARGGSLAALQLLIEEAGADAARNDPAYRSVVARIRAELRSTETRADAEEMFEAQFLPPIPRGLGREAMLAAARAEIAAGHRDQALGIIMTNGTSEMLRNDEEVMALRDTLIRELQASMAPARSAAYLERIAGYFTEQLEGLPDGRNVTDGRLVLGGFALAATELQDGAEFADDPAVARARATFRANLVGRQVAAFPAIRRAYCAALARQLWADDGYAACSAASARTLVLSSSLFAANGNIQEMYQSEAGPAGQLRFQHLEFRSDRGSPPRATYTLQSPPDTAVGTWENGEFRAIE